MSSDFLVDTREKGNPRFAIQVKTAEALDDPRTIEKLEIERRYWLEKRVPWYLVTENQIPSTVFENINLLYNHIDDDAELNDLMIQFELFSKHLPVSESLRIKDLCIRLDVAYDHEPGESLYQIKRLLAQRYFHFDIAKPFTELRSQT